MYKSGASSKWLLGVELRHSVCATCDMERIVGAGSYMSNCSSELEH